MSCKKKPGSVSLVDYQNSLNFWLEEYGFSSEEECSAIERLFNLSSIISSEQGWSQIFSKKSQGATLISDLSKITEQVQKKFVIRSHGEERGKVKASKFMKSYKSVLKRDLEILGVIQEVNPRNYSPDLICILGSAKSPMLREIDYVVSLMKKGLSANHLVLLTGERYVILETDGSKEELSALAKKLEIGSYESLTETDVFRDLYEKSELPKYFPEPHVIDTPREDLPRPTTETTLKELVKWLAEDQKIKNILFVSNQPHVKYQASIIDLVFDYYKLNINFEVAGPKVKDHEDTRQAIGALGSYIWAASPRIFSKIKCENLNDNLKKSLHQLYSPAKIIYNSLPNNLKFGKSG